MDETDGCSQRKMGTIRHAKSTSAIDMIGTTNKNEKKLNLMIPNLIITKPDLIGPLPDSVTMMIPSEKGLNSRLSSANFYRKRVTDVVEIPAKQLRKIKQQDIGSFQREAKHFCETTTMHGPKRVYKGKNYSLFFWTLMFIASIFFLCLQVYSLVQMYREKPTVSQVSFQINEKGIEFPVITICPFNPIKKTNFRNLNATGDFSDALLGYLLETNMEAPALYSSSNKENLEHGEALLKKYKLQHPEFNLYDFFKNYGFSCTDLMRWCTFGGRRFHCCNVARSVLTTIGKCQRIDIRSSGLEWMQKQTSGGHNAGLQLILDSQQDEQFDDINSTVASPLFERGFRYYIHDNVTVPYLASEGISVSPGMRVYSALSINKYVLLDEDNWGQCINKWPENYNVSFLYSAASCSAKCKAVFFFNNCGCSPSAYDIEDVYPVCSPLQVVNCIDKYMKNDNETGFELPQCEECKIECSSNMYQTFNSYGKEFSVPSMRWLAKKNSSWTPELIKRNFLTINVFFRDLTHTEYTQVQATSLTELLSNIGGNMGMFLGMSTITITEISLFLCKIFWIAFSRSRRNYMAEKKKREENQDKDVEETVKEFRRIRSCTDLHSVNNFRASAQQIEPTSFADLYIQKHSTESCDSSLNDAFKETDSGHATDR